MGIITAGSVLAQEKEGRCLKIRLKKRKLVWKDGAENIPIREIF